MIVLCYNISVGGNNMMYEYLTFPDQTLVTHSELREKDNKKFIEVYFEKPIEGGFCSANCILPSYEWTLIEGYSKEEIDFFTKFLVHNAGSLFKYASNGGIQIA